MAAPESIAIVATGPSLDVSKINADLIIAVNGAIELIVPHIWFTLDPSPANMARMQNPIPCVQYIAALQCTKKTPPHVLRLKRLAEEHRGAQPPGCGPDYWIWRWSAKLGLSESPGVIHTGNSAYGALGVAYHMRPKFIHLHGVDGTQEQRINGGRPRRLDHLPLLFESAKPQLDARGIQVFNHSKVSRVTCFPKMLK